MWYNQTPKEAKRQAITSVIFEDCEFGNLVRYRKQASILRLRNHTLQNTYFL